MESMQLEQEQRSMVVSRIAEGDRGPRSWRSYDTHRKMGDGRPKDSRSQAHRPRKTVDPR